jgi:MFS transporter, SP family, general alpha glucoside:H+ symporter
VDFNADETIAMMKHTNEVEKYLNPGTSYADCFKGTDLRRTEIASIVWMTQNLCGSALWGFAPYFYEQAGLSTTKAYDLSVGLYGLAIIANFLCWIWMKVAGRRTLYLIGLVWTLIILLATGSVGTIPTKPATSWTLGSLIIVLAFIFDTTLGPVSEPLSEPLVEGPDDRS